MPRHAAQSDAPPNDSDSDDSAPPSFGSPRAAETRTPACIRRYRRQLRVNEAALATTPAVPRPFVFPPEGESAAVERDWQRDSLGPDGRQSDGLDRAMFCAGWFQVADQWTEDMEPASYAQMLDWMYWVMSRPMGAGGQGQGGGTSGVGAGARRREGKALGLYQRRREFDFDTSHIFNLSMPSPDPIGAGRRGSMWNSKAFIRLRAALYMKPSRNQNHPWPILGMS